MDIPVRKAQLIDDGASQNDMLSALQRATGAKPSDWTITHIPVDQYIQEGVDKFAKGDFLGMINVLCGSTFKRGLGDQFHGRELANERLGLKEEDLDEVVRTEGSKGSRGEVVCPVQYLFPLCCVIAFAHFLQWCFLANLIILCNYMGREMLISVA